MSTPKSTDPSDRRVDRRKFLRTTALSAGAAAALFATPATEGATPEGSTHRRWQKRTNGRSMRAGWMSF